MIEKPSSSMTDSTSPAPSNSTPPNSWEFTPQDDNQSPIVDTPEQPADAPLAQEVSWTASEFIAHSKSLGWYAMVFVAAFIVAGLIYLLTRGDKISSIAVIVAALFFVIMAQRKPRTLQYSVDNRGITVGQKFYPYALFKSFSVLEQGAFSSISFMPLKRFMPFIEIYFSPQEGDQIINTISTHLPLELAREDMLDRFIKQIRF